MVTLKEAFEKIRGCLEVHIGYCHYIRRSEEWYEKPMMDIENLGTIWYTHKPFKMIEKFDGKEKDVWGDDWNDRSAENNSGPPYVDTCVDIAAGDLIIVIKQGVEIKEN